MRAVDSTTKVWERDKRICHICSRPVLRSEATLDHIIPRAAGGRDNAGNLRCAHAACNYARGTLPMAEVQAVIAALPPEKEATPWRWQQRVIQALRLHGKKFVRSELGQHRRWCVIRTRRGRLANCTCDAFVGA